MNACIALWIAGAMLFNIWGAFCQLDVCGQAPLKTRIVGGQNATEGAWPWQVTILAETSENITVFCGGSLIHKNWVLTAAQCVQSSSASNIFIVLGHWRLSVIGPNVKFRKVSQVAIHHSYDNKSMDNDIALLQLSSSVNFTDYIRPVCLAAAGSTFAAGTPSWITGWGKLSSEATQLPDIPQEVEIRIVSNSDCNNAYEGNITVTDNMMCAGQGGKGICYGDGGSPLVSKQGSQWIQSGITSFTLGCADPRYPAGYTRVSQYQSWINYYITGNQPGFVLFPITKFSTQQAASGSPSLPSFSLSFTFSIILFFFISVLKD